MTSQQLLVVGFLCVSAAVVAQGQEAPIAECRGYRGVDALQVREWAFDPGDPVFPEMSDPDLFVPAVRERAKDSFGIAFSGGGTRSASATLGQLRALAILGWLDRAQYVTAVSGGSWTTVPFTFLPQSPRFSDQGFLGAYLPPAKLTDEILAAAPDGSFAQALSSTKLAGLYLSRLFYRGDETYSRAIGKSILRDLDLYEGVRRDRETGPARLFAAHERQRARLVAGSRVKRPNDSWRNLCSEDTQEGRLCDEEFLLPAPGRPFLIVGATFFETKARARRDQLHPVELTPLYSGIRKELKLEREDPARLGGGFIESAAYDGISRRELEAGPGGSAEVEVCFKSYRISRYRYRLTLSDVMGASGAAPVALLRRFGFDTVGFPEFRHRPIGKNTPEAGEFAHGDGAHIDNLGLLPLLARGVKRILVFVNTQEEFSSENDRVATMSSDIRCYFVPDPSAETDTTCYTKKGVKKDGTVAVFARKGLEELEDHFVAMNRDKKPLIYCGDFTVEAVDPYGIRSYTPKICWFHLARNETWMEAVREVADSRGPMNKLAGKQRPFQQFPHYRTVADRWWKLRIIDLSEEQVNALAHLSAWEVLTAAEEIGRGLFGEGPPPGGYPAPEVCHPIPEQCNEVPS